MAGDWRDEYRRRRKEAGEAVKLLRSGSRIFLGSGCGEPRHLVRAMAAAADHLKDVEVIHVLALAAEAYADPRLADSFRPKRFFVAAGARKAVAEGGAADFTPIYLSEVPRLLASGRWTLDAALVQVSPPDEHGWLSLGVAVDVVQDAVEQSRVVIAQVNPQMPRTLGDSFVHVSRLTALVEHDEPLLSYTVSPPDAVEEKVAAHAAKLIKDGATIHVGLGRIPQAVLGQLGDRRNLGVHTDLLTDSYVDLVEAGAITGRGKTLLPRKIVASFCMGTRRLFDFVHNNPMVEMHPVRFTNEPEVIAQNSRMIAVHEGVEVDLTGQVRAELVGSTVYSGLGGMVDFLRGAQKSPGGQSVVVLTSLGPDGSSRIRASFGPGAGVVVTRAGVRTVVTEYGAAHLHGLSLAERAVALIDIAHPRHRESLLAEAREAGLIAEGGILAPLFTGIYPEQYEKQTALKDGSQVLLRPVKPTDERMVQEFFYGMSDREVYYRFLHSLKAFPRKDMQKMVNIDYDREMSVVGMTGEFDDVAVVGVGRYVIGDDGRPEVDFAVDSSMQGKGLGRAIMRHLFSIAKDRGFTTVVAYVMTDNQASGHILTTSGYAVTGTVSQGVIEMEIHLDRPVDEPSVELTYESRWGNPVKTTGQGEGTLTNI